MSCRKARFVSLKSIDEHYTFIRVRHEASAYCGRVHYIGQHRSAEIMTPIVDVPPGVRLLVQQYVGQLSDGCGNSACREVICDSGRRNIAPANRPVRGYTPRSARAIALGIAGGTSPRRHLCKYYEAKTTRKRDERQEVGVSQSARSSQCQTTALASPAAVFCSVLPSPPLLDLALY